MQFTFFFKIIVVEIVHLVNLWITNRTKILHARFVELGPNNLKK